MASQQSDLLDVLPSGVTVDEAVRVLKNPRDINFYRFLARILEHTTDLDRVREYVDAELLVGEYQKIRNHMKHGELEGSTRTDWDQTVRDLAAELGMNVDLPDPETPGSPSGSSSGSSSRSPSGSSPELSSSRSDAKTASGKPVPIDPSTVEVEKSPSSADETEKTSRTGSAKGNVEESSEMMKGVQEDVGFNEQVSGAARSVSEELRQLRQKREVTRNDLAEASGISLQEISQIERGRKELTYDLIERYVDGLNMSVRLDFKQEGKASEDLLQKVKTHIDRTIDSLDIPDELARHTRIVLHQIAEDGLYQKRFPTLLDALNYLEEAVKSFSIREEAPDASLFSNSTLFNFLKSRMKNLEYSDLAYDENIKIVAQKLLERYHEE